jgi:hypothetical protein
VDLVSHLLFLRLILVIKGWDESVIDMSIGTYLLFVDLTDCQASLTFHSWLSRR